METQKEISMTFECLHSYLAQCSLPQLQLGAFYYGNYVLQLATLVSIAHCIWETLLRKW